MRYRAEVPVGHAEGVHRRPRDGEGGGRGGVICVGRRGIVLKEICLAGARHRAAAYLLSVYPSSRRWLGWHGRLGHGARALTRAFRVTWQG